MFHERDVGGPFRLGCVSLANSSAMPNALANLVENAHTTRAYRKARFHRRSFDDPHLLRAARSLEGEAARR